MYLFSKAALLFKAGFDDKIPSWNLMDTKLSMKPKKRKMSLFEVAELDVDLALWKSEPAQENLTN